MAMDAGSDRSLAALEDPAPFVRSSRGRGRQGGGLMGALIRQRQAVACRVLYVKYALCLIKLPQLNHVAAPPSALSPLVPS